MNINQIIILAIVILASVILTICVYFLITFLLKRKRKKKDKVTFNPELLIEQEPLFKVMEEKTRTVPTINNDKIVIPKDNSKFLTDNYEPIDKPSVPNTNPTSNNIEDPFHMKFEKKENQDDIEVFMK